MIKYLIIPLLLLSTFDSSAELFQKATSQNTTIDSTIFYRSVNVYKARKIIEQNSTNSRFVIIDVRAEKDYSQGHIQNAINIDFKSSDFKARLDSLDKTKTYIVICYAGVRSKNTMQLMEKLNFKKVYSIKGGMMKWKGKKLPTTSN